MSKQGSRIERTINRIWQAGGQFGLVVAIAVAFSLGFFLKGSFAPESAPPPAVPMPHEGHEAAQEQVWTCSMHPQVQQPKKGKCPICGMDLIPLSKDGGDDMAGMRQFTTSAAARELMNIQTSPVERRFVTADIRMVGKINYDETKLGYITAWVPGRLDRLYVDFTGIKVGKGDHMVYLYSPELLAAQDELRRAALAVNKMRPDAPEVLKKTAHSTLGAARDKLRRWGLTTGQIEEAEGEGAFSDHVTIYAPMAGTVIHRDGQEGMYVKEGTKIYTIADLSQVWVLLDAYESDLAWLHYGQSVEFVTEAYPGETFTGKISFIAPTLNQRTRTAKVRVNVSNKDGKLKPEMFVRAVVHAQVATGGRVMDAGLAGKWIGPMHPEIVKDAPGSCDVCGMPLVKAEDLGYVPVHATEDDMPLVIPATAPLITGSRAIVYVEVPDRDRPTYEGREIVLGSRAGNFYIVRSGLAEGERVVTNGNFKIDSALQIMAKPSMMTPDGGGGGGGHDHGGGGPKKAEDKGVPAAELLFASREQFAKLIDAYASLSAMVEDNDSDRIAEAAETFGAAIDGVDMSLLSGHAHMVWMEYSTRIRNDLVEVRDASGGAERNDLMTGLQRNMATLRAQLGLREEANASSGAAARAPAAFQSQLRSVYEVYGGIQSALAGDDLAGARKAAVAMSSEVNAVDMGLLEGQAHMAWMDRVSRLNEALKTMEEAAGIEELRAALAPLSDALSESVSAFGIAQGDAVYLVHCPMALDMKGANWLQSGTEVRNPYYGESMLSCGSVEARLDAAGAVGQGDEGSDHEGPHDD